MPQHCVRAAITAGEGGSRVAAAGVPRRVGTRCGTLVTECQKQPEAEDRQLVLVSGCFQRRDARAYRPARRWPTI
jgi:hypothetical protein